MKNMADARLVSISLVYKYLHLKQWFYTVSGPFLQKKKEKKISANIHRWNIFLIEALSMLPVKSQAFLTGHLFLSRRSVEFQFVWQKLSYHIPLSGLLQRHVGLPDTSAKYQKSFVCLPKMCLRNDDLSTTCQCGQFRLNPMHVNAN